MPEVAFTERDVADLYAYRAIGSTPAEITKKIADLEKDNQKERSKVAGLEEKAAKVPAEGAVVLTGEDAAKWPKYVALGEPDALEKLQGERDTLAADKRTRDRKDLLRAARETEEWNEQAPDVLQNTTGFDALELTEGEVTVEVMNAGKKENVKRKTAFATVDGKPVRVAELVKEKWPYLGTVLAATGGNGSGGDTPGRNVFEQRGTTGGGTQTRTAEDHAKATRSKVDYTV